MKHMHTLAKGLVAFGLVLHLELWKLSSMTPQCMVHMRLDTCLSLSLSLCASGLLWYSGVGDL